MTPRPEARRAEVGFFLVAQDVADFHRDDARAPREPARGPTIWRSRTFSWSRPLLGGESPSGYT